MLKGPDRVLHKTLARLPGASKSQIRASILKDQNIQLPDSDYLKVYCGHMTFNINMGGGGCKWGASGVQVKMPFGKCFLLYLYFTCPNG